MPRLLQWIVVQSNISEGPRREGIRKVVHTADNPLLEEHGALVEAHHRRVITVGTQSFGDLAEELDEPDEETSVANGSKVIYSSVEEGLVEGRGFAEPPAADGACDCDHDNMLCRMQCKQKSKKGEHQ